MVNNQHWIAVCRQMVTEHHSKARKAWNNLRPAQRRLLLLSAELSTELCHREWERLSNRELRLLKRGVQRLRALAGQFGAISDLDFVHPVKTTAIPAPRKRDAAISHVHSLIAARDQLAARSKALSKGE